MGNAEYMGAEHAMPSLPRGWESCVLKSGKPLYYKGDPDHPPTEDAEGVLYFDTDYPVEEYSLARPRDPDASASDSEIFPDRRRMVNLRSPALKRFSEATRRRAGAI